MNGNVKNNLKFTQDCKITNLMNHEKHQKPQNGNLWYSRFSRYWNLDFGRAQIIFEKFLFDL